MTLAFAALLFTLFLGLLAIGAFLTPDDPELDDGELKALERIQRKEIGGLWR